MFPHALNTLCCTWCNCLKDIIAILHCFLSSMQSHHLHFPVMMVGWTICPFTSCNMLPLSCLSANILFEIKVSTTTHTNMNNKGCPWLSPPSIHNKRWAWQCVWWRGTWEMPIQVLNLKTCVKSMLKACGSMAKHDYHAKRTIFLWKVLQKVLLKAESLLSQFQNLVLSVNSLSCLQVPVHQLV